MKDIPGYEGLYAVTSCGKVWSYRSQKFLQPVACCGGEGEYLAVNLYDECGVHKLCTIHRLVAKAYIPNPKGLPVIDHVDGNTMHNYVNNLEWVTQPENVLRGFRKRTRERINRSRSRKIGGNHNG